MNKTDFHRHFRDKANQFGFLTPENETVDGIKIGSDSGNIIKMAISWKATMNNLLKAHQSGCDFFVCHESLFCNGGKGLENSGVVTIHEHAKLKWLQTIGMTVYRLHDGWDLFPEYGILDSWQTGLGFADAKIVESKGCIRLLEIPPINFTDLTSDILSKIKSLGQNSIQVQKTKNELVRRLIITAGAAGKTVDMLDMNPDAIIRSDDWFNWVREGELTAELGVGLIIVNHATSEEWGMRNLGKYLKDKFTNLKTLFLPGGCEYESMGH